MVTAQEIEQAVDRLKAAGFWAMSRQHIDQESVERRDAGSLINGAGEIPQPVEGESDLVTALLNTEFQVWYFDKGMTYSGIVWLGQAGVPVKKSEQLDTVITAIINYFEMRKALPNDEQDWGPVSQREYSIVSALYWLQEAGASAEITSAADISATFGDHTYTLHLNGTSREAWLIGRSDSDEVHHAHSLESVVLYVLATQCKLTSQKDMS